MYRRLVTLSRMLHNGVGWGLEQDETRTRGKAVQEREQGVGVNEQHIF